MALLQSLLASYNPYIGQYHIPSDFNKDEKSLFLKNAIGLLLAFLVMYLLSLTGIIILPTQTIRYHYCE